MRSVFFVFLIFISALPNVSAQAVFQRSFIKMGSAFDLTLVAVNQLEANQLFEQAIAEIDRIERLISSWDQASETSQVNQMAGKEAVKVTKELYDLVFRAKAIAQLTMVLLILPMLLSIKYGLLTGEILKNQRLKLYRLLLLK